MPIFLKNPHSILAVLETRPQDIFEIRLPAARAGGVWETVRATAQQIGIKISQHNPRHNRRRPGGERQNAGRTGAAEAVVKEREGVPLETLFSGASDRAGGKGLWLALDTVQDPQNMGAIFRTAAFFGVQGILLTRNRSAPLSGVAYDVASGGVEYVPFSLQTNLSRALDAAKALGLWALGTSEHAETDLDGIEPDRPWLLILGNEETGIRRLTRDKCDVVCKIPPWGKVASLNVSVAAGVLMHRLSPNMKDTP